jgi:hypothetical protein
MTCQDSGREVTRVANKTSGDLVRVTYRFCTLPRVDVDSSP